jgi:hypothetical protein
MGLVSPQMEERRAEDGGGMSDEAPVAGLLAEIAQKEDGLEAAIARALIPFASAPEKENALCRKEVNERLFALINRCIARGEEPTAVLEALVSIDRHLSRAGAFSGPLACLFAPSAAVLILHVEAVAWTERAQMHAAEDAPIFEIGKNTLCAVAAAPMGQSGAALFADRVLGAVLKKKTSAVRIVVRLRRTDAEEIDAVLDALCRDLTRQRISVTLDRVSTDRQL